MNLFINTFESLNHAIGEHTVNTKCTVYKAMYSYIKAKYKILLKQHKNCEIY